MSVYLDYAAATPVSNKVMTAMSRYFSEDFYNPSAMYGPAVRTSKALEAARSQVAQHIGAKPSEIIFTAGGTEANNLAIHGVMGMYPDAATLISTIEHDSVRKAAELYDCQFVEVTNQGLVEVTALKDAITDSTVLVSIMYANNEIGTVQPIRAIAAEIETLRRQRSKNGNKLPLYLHVDAAQAGNYLDMHIHRLGVDFMTINGGKLYGPKQSGILFIKSGIMIKPLLNGGGQERNLRSGTENVAFAVGFAAALEQTTQKRHTEAKRLQILQKYFIEQLQGNFPEITVNGSLKHRLPNNIHVTIPGTDNERVLMALDMYEVYAAAGSACSASHDEPSHVLRAIGFNTAHIQSSVRFSMGRQTTQSQIDQTIEALKQILA